MSLATVLLIVVAIALLAALVASGAARPATEQAPTRKNPPHSSPRKASVSGNGNARPRHPDPTPHQLDAEKTLAAFQFILKSLGQPLPWKTPPERSAYLHDLVVMLQHGDLETASLELLGRDQTILFRHRVQFGAGGSRPARDPAWGIELPLLSRAQIADHRILVEPAAHIGTYRHQLRLNWTSAKRLRERPGSRFESQHTRRITAQRMTAQVFVTEEARCRGTIYHVSPAGDYAFARHPNLPADVFLHLYQCDQPLQFQPGQEVSFIPVQTPRGVQGRNIRPV